MANKVLDPVTGEAIGFFDRARKAVVAAAYSAVAAFGVSIGALAQAGDLHGGDYLKAAAAAVGVGLAGLGVTYKAKANEPALDIPPKRQGV